MTNIQIKRAATKKVASKEVTVKSATKKSSSTSTKVVIKKKATQPIEKVKKDSITRMDSEHFRLRFYYQNNHSNRPSANKLNPNFIKEAKKNRTLSSYTICEILRKTDDPAKDDLVIDFTSECSFRDNFDRKVGRQIAFLRAMQCAPNMSKKDKAEIWGIYANLKKTDKVMEVKHGAGLLNKKPISHAK